MRDREIKKVKKAYAASLACTLLSLAGLAVGAAVEVSVLGAKAASRLPGRASPLWSLA